MIHLTMMNIMDYVVENINKIIIINKTRYEYNEKCNTADRLPYLL